MKIYTKAGDDGRTSRTDGKRLSKSDPLLEALGTVDELDAHLGFCRATAAGDDHQEDVAHILAILQPQMLSLGATIAAAGAGKDSPAHLSDSHVEAMERTIDKFTAAMPELTNFILPVGCELACRLHVARTVCRR